MNSQSPSSPSEVKRSRSSCRGAGARRREGCGAPRGAGRPLSRSPSPPTPTPTPRRRAPAPPLPESPAAATTGKIYRAPAGPSPGRARAPVIGGWFAAHMFLCLARPRALFAQQHVVPLEEIEPTLKVQGTAKLCWEAAGPGPGEGLKREAGPAPSRRGPRRGVGVGGTWRRAVLGEGDCRSPQSTSSVGGRAFCSGRPALPARGSGL